MTVNSIYHVVFTSTESLEFMRIKVCDSCGNEKDFGRVLYSDDWWLVDVVQNVRFTSITSLIDFMINNHKYLTLHNKQD